MNFKIFNLKGFEFLIARYEDEGIQTVQIRAFIVEKDKTDLMIEDEYEFLSREAAAQFVQDYSEKAAELFIQDSILRLNIDSKHKKS